MATETKTAPGPAKNSGTASIATKFTLGASQRALLVLWAGKVHMATRYRVPATCEGCGGPAVGSYSVGPREGFDLCYTACSPECAVEARRKHHRFVCCLCRGVHPFESLAATALGSSICRACVCRSCNEPSDDAENRVCDLCAGDAHYQLTGEFAHETVVKHSLTTAAPDFICGYEICHVCGAHDAPKGEPCSECLDDLYRETFGLEAWQRPSDHEAVCA